MTKEKKNVPALRFPGFSEEWEEKKLGDVLTVLDGDRGKNYPSETDFSETGHTLFLNASNVTKNGFLFNQRQYITEEKSISMGNGKLAENDVVLTTRGSIGNVGWYNNTIYSKMPFARINSGMLILRTYNDIKAQFLSHFLRSTLGKRSIKRISFGSAQPQLTKKDINLFKVNLPEMNEQQKIGDFFSKLDCHIKLEEEKLALLEAQKKGYMQKIFSQELRFKDDNGEEYPEWEEHKLGEVYKVTMGQSPKSINYTDDHSYPVLVQGNADLYKGNIYPRIYTKETTKLVKDGDILLTVRAPVGEVGIAQFEACIGRGVCSIEGDKFIYYHLEYFNLQSKWQKLSQGSTFESISGSEVRNVEVSIPSASEREDKSLFHQNRSVN
ncbi:restriction endonuclease subunit S [Staphylococcus delphini]|uniref:restriction endonuclease subunit S n=1 Tax=Staphylococcus delphini TaxID=53344 RepID=UPI0021D00559|nr:restriction endonuclease subunit S [Staphylococcus delphini]UXS43811.1 restriction endonuclease subunit S [Staphylococcus delphini]UXV44437.1 restriction endonuclease subunit S [Staphylococcus delphini]